MDICIVTCHVAVEFASHVHCGSASDHPGCRISGGGRERASDARICSKNSCALSARWNGNGVAPHTSARGAFMFKVIVGLTLCMGLATAVAAQDPKIAQGEKLFADQKCTLCHSIADKGNKKGPLDGVASKLKADEIREWIEDAKGMTAKTKTTRKPDMKAYTLPKDDVDALVAYIVTLKK
jgi:mono/diheme cytochrome c family protein